MRQIFLKNMRHMPEISPSLSFIFICSGVPSIKPYASKKAFEAIQEHDNLVKIFTAASYQFFSQLSCLYHCQPT